MQIQDCFIKGDMKGAIEYMRCHEKYKEELPRYVALFEREQYIHYDVPEPLGRILRAYQIYFRDVFYCQKPETEAAETLLSSLQTLLDLAGADEEQLAERMEPLFEANGYHAQFGKTQGYFGPYIWRETVPTVYTVELPFSTAKYTVNLLKGFVLRSWMAYLTFGRAGTGGWTLPDGTIQCIEEAYDFESEAFRVSLLKHEAQHAEDMKCYPDMTSPELEYRAKLVELCFSQNPELLSKFFVQADENRTNDGHAIACVRIRREFEKMPPTEISAIQTKARSLLAESNREMNAKYGK